MCCIEGLKLFEICKCFSFEIFDSFVVMFAMMMAEVRLKFAVSLRIVVFIYGELWRCIVYRLSCNVMIFNIKLNKVVVVEYLLFEKYVNKFLNFLKMKIAYIKRLNIFCVNFVYLFVI